MNQLDPAVVTQDQEVISTPAAIHHDPGSARQDAAAWDALHREEKRDVRDRHLHFYTAGRLLLGALFLAMAYPKLTNLRGAVQLVSITGFGSPGILVECALGIELAGGLLLTVGWRVRIAAGVMIAYLVLMTLLLTGAQTLALNNASPFANVAMIAGLLLLAAHGAGGASLETYLSRRRKHAADLQPAKESHDA